jgi:hypothetical protein
MGKTFRTSPSKRKNPYAKTETTITPKNTFINRQEQRVNGLRADKNSRFVMRDYESETD